jgi:ketosteroid isomerase-like protein
MTSDRSDEIRGALERYAAAWASGDLAGIIACYHDDFTLHYFGRNALSGDHAGKAAALKALAEFSRRTSRRLIKVESILAGPDLGALRAREIIKHRGEEIEIERVFLYTVQDGLLRECWLYDQDQRLVDDVVGAQ